jgi:hypothetical protein
MRVRQDGNEDTSGTGGMRVSKKRGQETYRSIISDPDTTILAPVLLF